MYTSDQILGQLYAEQQYRQGILHQSRQQRENTPIYMPPPPPEPPRPPQIAVSPITAPGVVGAGIYRPMLYPNFGSVVASMSGLNPALQSLGYMHPLEAAQQAPTVLAAQFGNYYGSVARFAGAALPFALMYAGIDPFSYGARFLGHSLAHLGGFGHDFVTAEKFFPKAAAAVKGIGRFAWELPTNPVGALGRLATATPELALGIGSLIGSMGFWELGRTIVEQPLKALQTDIAMHQTINRTLGDVIFTGETPTGRGVTLRQAAGITQQLMPLTRRFFTNRQDIFAAAQQAMQSGMAIVGATTPEQLGRNLKDIAEKAYTIAEGLTTTVETATKILERWKEIGVNVTTLNDVRNFTELLKNLSAVGGMNTVTTQRLMSAGGVMGQQLGLERGISAISMGRIGAYGRLGLQMGVLPETLFRSITGGTLDIGTYSQRMFGALSTFTRGGMGLAFGAALLGGATPETMMFGGPNAFLNAAQNTLGERGSAYILAHQRELRSIVMKRLSENPREAYIFLFGIARSALGHNPSNDELVAIAQALGLDEDTARAILYQGLHSVEMGKRAYFNELLNTTTYEYGKYYTQHTLWGRIRQGMKDISYDLLQSLGFPIAHGIEWGAGEIAKGFRSINEITVPSRMKHYKNASIATARLLMQMKNLPTEVRTNQIDFSKMTLTTETEQEGRDTILPIRLMGLGVYAAGQVIKGATAATAAGLEYLGSGGYSVGGSPYTRGALPTKEQAAHERVLSRITWEGAKRQFGKIAGFAHWVFYGNPEKAYYTDIYIKTMWGGKLQKTGAGRFANLTPEQDQILENVINWFIKLHEDECKKAANNGKTTFKRCIIHNTVISIRAARKGGKLSDDIYSFIDNIPTPQLLTYITRVTGFGYAEALQEETTHLLVDMSHLVGKNENEITKTIQEGQKKGFSGEKLIGWVQDRLGVHSAKLREELGLFLGGVAQSKWEAELGGIGITKPEAALFFTGHAGIEEVNKLAEGLTAFGGVTGKTAELLAGLATGRTGTIQHIMSEHKNMYKLLGLQTNASAEEVAARARSFIYYKLEHSKELQEKKEKESMGELIKVVDSFTRRLSTVAKVMDNS